MKTIYTTLALLSSLLFFQSVKAQQRSITDTSLLWIGSKHGTNDSIVYWFSNEDTTISSRKYTWLYGRYQTDTFRLGGMHQDTSGLVSAYFKGYPHVLPQYQLGPGINASRFAL